MYKKSIILLFLVLLTGWGFNKKELHSYADTARPSQTRTLKALAARLYIEAMVATEDILRLANSLCGIQEFAAENTPCMTYVTEHYDLKKALQSFISETSKREKEVNELTKPTIEAFKKRIDKIESKFQSQKTLNSKTELIKQLFEEFRKALVMLNISYSTLTDALKRVKATYHENQFSLPDELDFKSLEIDAAIKQSSDNQVLHEWLNQSDFYKKSLKNLQY